MTAKRYDEDLKNPLFLYMRMEDHLIPFPVNTVFPFPVLLNGAECILLFLLKKERFLLPNKLRSCRKEMLFLKRRILY